jgi:glycosyltransferase involved in cell wall biosynthesis
MNSGECSKHRARIVLTLLTRDEADIIAHNLDYHQAQGVDWIIVTDNGSTDGTREILEQYAQRGGVTLLFEPPADFSQHRWVTRMARLAYTHHAADWVINADADEFFVSRRGDLRQDLASCASADVVLAARRDFISLKRLLQVAPVEMVYRKAVSCNLAGKPLSPKAIHRGAPDVVVTQGNHEATSQCFRPETVASPIEIFHYPIRSRAQFERKVRNGGSGYAQNSDLRKNVGFHKRYWYELLQHGELDLEYERHAFSPVRLSAGLATGQLLEDRAVADWFGDASAGEAPQLLRSGQGR